MKQSIKSIICCITALLIAITQSGYADKNSPPTGEITYGQTLESVHAFVNGIPGRWDWIDPEYKPQAGTEEFEAIFVPNDTSNYETVSAMVQVTTVPAQPKVTGAHAEVKSGTKLSQISNITYTATGVKSEALSGSFTLAEDDIALDKGKTGYYRFTFRPDSSNYADIETQVYIDVADNHTNGISGGSMRPAVPTHTVAYDFGENGKLVSGVGNEKVKEAQYPQRVPNVKPNDGYQFLGWSLDDTTIVNPLTVQINEDTIFLAIYGPVDETMHSGYLSGYEDGTFRPDAEITRAETAAVIAKISSHYDPAQAYSASYTDMADAEWSVNYVGFAEQQRLVTGYIDGTFKPETAITRAEFAVMISRYLNLSPDDGCGFADTQGHWAAGYIAALQRLGAVQGYPDQLFHPDQTITRAEVVKVINAILGRNTICSESLDNPFVDLSQDHWAYNDILEASTTHKARNAKSVLSALTD